MTALVRELSVAAGLQLRLWWRAPKHILVSVALSIAFLVLANRVLVVRLGRHVSVGVHTRSQNVALNAERQFNAFDVTTVRYDTLEQGRDDLARGAIIGLMSVPEDDPRAIRVIFSGRNPLVDRELASVLLNVASSVSTNSTRRAHIIMENNRYTPDVMTTHMTAGLIPFLLLALASVNFGLFWLCDYEKGTLYTLLALPVRRGALIAGRLAGSVVVILGTFVLTVWVCRMIVPWEIGAQPVLWWLAVGLQAITMCGMFFALATVCRQYAVYSDAGLILAFVLMFVSGALTPVAAMPPWARVLGACTPTYYAVRLMRAVMTGTETPLPRDALALVLWAAATFVSGYWRLLHAVIDRRR